MERVKSISKAEKVFPTAQKPMLILCDDFEYYVCKYNTRKTSCDLLLREYIVAHFLELWSIPGPKFKIIDVRHEHLHESVSQIYSPCFGTQYLSNSTEVAAFWSNLPESLRKRYFLIDEYLRVAFFDYWVSNEDRHPGNYNLLIDHEGERYKLIPIDHDACFHTGTQDRENHCINPEESLLTSPIFSKMSKSNIFADKSFITSLIEMWYLCAKKCSEHLQAIIEMSPDEWRVDKEQMYEQLRTFMFSDDWFKLCKKEFLTTLQTQINK